MRHILAAAALGVLAMAGGAMAQEVTAEVQTWNGRTLVLGDPTFEVFYTIVLPERAAAAPGYGPGIAGGPAAPGAPLPSGVTVSGVDAGGVGSGGTAVIGSQGVGSIQATVGGLLPRGPDAAQGRRQQQVLVLSRDGIETRVPVANLVALLFVRQQVIGSALPPWVAGSHFQYAASAVLGDGTQVQADYVNLGTSVLRGTTPQGIVDIPWFEVESIKFRR